MDSTNVFWNCPHNLTVGYSEDQPDDVLDQSSTLDDLVSDILNDSAESSSSIPTTTVQGHLASNNFQNISPRLPLPTTHNFCSSGVERNDFPRNNLQDGWMKYPMVGSQKPAMCSFNKGTPSPRMICSDVKTSTTPSPECSSYADVTRGSAALSTAANTIQTSTPQAFSDKPKMLFENFVELGKFGNFHSQGIPDNMRDMSNVRNGFDRGNQYPLKDQMYPNVKTFTPPKTDYEFVKGFGDVALNPHLLQANNGFHKAGSNHFQPYTNRPNLNDISKLQTRYQSELSQLYGTNLSGINGNPRGPVPSDSPYNNINHLTNHVGYTGATNNPWYKQNEIHSINALLYQASGITGLPPVPPKRLPNALPSAKIHDGVITSEVEMCKEQVGTTLQGSLNGCYNELQNLERERKKYETDLSQQFMGKRITSSNGIAVTSLPADPTPVDQLICDMYKEYNRIVTLTSKIGGLTKEGLNENIERTLDSWSDAIQKVEGHRRAELSHSLRKLSPESVKQLYSPGNNLIAKLAFLFEITRQVRTALWLSTVYAMHGTDRIASNMRVA